MLFDPEFGMKFIEPFGEALDVMTRAAIAVFGAPKVHEQLEAPYYIKD